MKTYLVGGAVRDEILGREVKDRDYVVVGAIPEHMLHLGYKQVGCDFPVFLHPETHEEYALARTESKSGAGYQGFSCDFGEGVTLEEDLSRRDLTINAMAKDEETGTIVDPFGGGLDICFNNLRHTTEAFADDPVRVLRTYRLLARFGEHWSVDPGTEDLCKELILNEFEHLTAERVWLETQKALTEDNTTLYFKGLHGIGEMYWFKEVWDLSGIPQREDHHPEVDTLKHIFLCLEQADKLKLSPEQKWAVLCHDLGKAPCYKLRGNLHGHEGTGARFVEALCDRLKVPKSYRDLAVKVCIWHTHCHKALEMKPNKIMKLFEGLGAFRNPDLLFDFLQCCETDAKGRLGFENRNYPQQKYLQYCFIRAMEVNTKDVVKSTNKTGKALGEHIRVLRIDKIREEKNKWKTMVN